jgi:hypothetical protein
MMKTLKTSSRRVVVIVALLAVTTIVTVVGMTAVVVPASSIVKPAYAQLDDISGEQITVGEEIEIPDSDAIREKAREIIASQSVPTLPELGTLLPLFRPPPALAG